MSIRSDVWEEVFQNAGRVFNDPHPDMPGIVRLLKDRGASRVLDLGFGTGRHVVYFAKNGFSVYGLDNSPTGLDMTAQWLEREHLSADLLLQDMREEFPWCESVFDAVISVQVLHHADIATIRRIIREIERVMKMGGFVFVTVPHLKNQASEYREIEPGTLVPLDGREKGLLHHYFTPEELRDCFRGFEVLDTHVDQVDHYCLKGFKLY